MLTRAGSAIYADKNIFICDAFLMIHVGHLVRILREARGWTGKELARRAQVDKMTIVRVEKNRYKPETLERVARALNTTPADLLSMAERMDAAYGNTWLPTMGASSGYECKEHAGYHRMLEEILHTPGKQRWAQCLLTNIEALYYQAIVEAGKSPMTEQRPALPPEAEIRDDQVPLPKRRKGKSAATG